MRIGRILPLGLVTAASLAYSAGERPWKIFLLFGQSNMAGGAASSAEDRVVHPRVKMLAYDNCSSPSRTYDQWYPAAPNLHGCGTGMGLGDWFGRVVADSLRNDTIALVPCAIPGVDISFFSKDVVSSRRKEFRIPPDNHWAGAYPWMLERLKLAKEKGEIAGILFHQGESDWSDTARKAWVGRVAAIVKNLKADVGFGDVPFLAGELRADAAACCGAHNTYVATLARTVPNGAVVSSKSLPVASDAYHLTAEGNREFGKRYAAAMLASLPTSSVGSRIGSDRGWSLAHRAGAEVLEFDREQDRIDVLDAQGRILAQGAGRNLGLPAHRGVLLIRAVSGSKTVSCIVPAWSESGI